MVPLVLNHGHVGLLRTEEMWGSKPSLMNKPPDQWQMPPWIWRNKPPHQYVQPLIWMNKTPAIGGLRHRSARLIHPWLTSLRLIGSFQNRNHIHLVIEIKVATPGSLSRRMGRPLKRRLQFLLGSPTPVPQTGSRDLRKPRRNSPETWPTNLECSKAQTHIGYVRMGPTISLWLSFRPTQPKKSGANTQTPEHGAAKMPRTRS